MSRPVFAKHRLLTVLAAWIAVAAATVPRAVGAQMPEGLPFQAGERLTYDVRMVRLGKSGSAVMSIDGPVEIRGVAAYALRFDFTAKVGPIKAADRAASWIDFARMSSLRYSKDERHPFANRNETVDILLDRGRWEAADGMSGDIASLAPLDELSFMYFIRTLTLVPDSVYQFNRHFDARRNPTTVRMVGRDTVTTGAGCFPAVVVEMRVRDSRRFEGESVVRIYLSDDHLRLPVRIENSMPVVGATVLTLQSHTQPRAHGAAPAVGDVTPPTSVSDRSPSCAALK